MGNFIFNIILFGISGGEILVIMLLVLLLFGPKKIPEIARMFGRGINEFKKVQREINTEITRYSSEVETQTREMQSQINSMVDEKSNIQANSADSLQQGSQEPKNEDSEDSKASQQPDDDLPYPYNKKTGDS